MYVITANYIMRNTGLRVIVALVGFELHVKNYQLGVSFVGLLVGFLLPPVIKNKNQVRKLLSSNLQVVQQGWLNPKHAIIWQWWILKNLPLCFLFPSLPLGFPSQPGRVLTSGSAGEHSLTHRFDLRLRVRPSLHSEQTPDVQFRQPRAQSENNKVANR